MDISRVKTTLLAASLLFCLSIVLSAYAWARSSHLSLPLPLAVAGTSVFHPIVSAIVIPFASITLRNRYKNAAVLSEAISYVLTLIPAVLLTLASVYAVPSQLSACSLEAQWAHLFRTKNADAVRAIQSSLRCCGLNSMHDRAWPFPTKGIDAGECERTQGWNVRCLDGWREQQARMAGLIAVACLANWALVVILVYMMRRRQHRLPWTRHEEARGAVMNNADLSSRLLGHQEEEESEASGDQRRRQIAEAERYADDEGADADGNGPTGLRAVNDRAFTDGDDGEEVGRKRGSSNAAVHISSLHR